MEVRGERKVENPGQSRKYRKRPARISGDVFSEPAPTLLHLFTLWALFFRIRYSIVIDLGFAQVNLRYNNNSCNSCSSVSFGYVLQRHPKSNRKALYKQSRLPRGINQSITLDLDFRSQDWKSHVAASGQLMMHVTVATFIWGS